MRLARRPLLWMLSAVLLRAAAATAQVPHPTTDGPITGPGAIFLQGTAFDLAEVGYVQEEYFVSGTARAFTNTAPLGTDGKWSVVAGDSAAYTTRIVVQRPASRKKFNGTVVVEWLNVSGGVDAAPDWMLGHTELIHSGFAWVGVSAQIVGVEGGVGLVPVASLPLKTVNPERYGSLHHPGDSFSYDIFSQVGQALRQPAGTDPLGDLAVKRVLAVGESQSAFRLVTYINALHGGTRLYDGYLVHSRGSIGAPLAETPQPVIPVPGTAVIRDDIDVPVLTLETESDLTFLNYFAARQEDGPNFRLWEVAGTAHADAYLVVTAPTDLGRSPDVVGLVVTTSPVPGIQCNAPINSGPHHFAVNAAFAALDKWVRSGKPPRPAPRLEVLAGPPVTIARDEYGVGRGGIRMPQVDVPIASFTGEQPGALICALFGTTTPFDAPTLAALYPTHRTFVSAYKKSVTRAVRAGWIVPRDGKLMRRWAAASDVGR